MGGKRKTRDNTIALVSPSRDGFTRRSISVSEVAKARIGRAFRLHHACCTLLGLAFMEKGHGVAAIWYDVRCTLRPRPGKCPRIAV